MKIIFKVLIVSIFVITTSFVPTRSKYEKQLAEIEKNLSDAKADLKEVSVKLNN